MLVYELITEQYQLHGIKPKEEAYFSKVVEFLTKTLKIPSSVNIDIAFNPRVEFSANQTGLTFPNPKNKNHIFVFIAPGLSNGERVLTIAHEFLHVKQLVTGKMTIDVINGKYVVTWEGKQVEMKYSPNNPWEVEAHEKDKVLGKQALSAVGNLI